MMMGVVDVLKKRGLEVLTATGPLAKSLWVLELLYCPGDLTLVLIVFMLNAKSLRNLLMLHVFGTCNARRRRSGSASGEWTVQPG